MKKYNNEDVIVALTSFGTRLNDAVRTIFSIIKQTHRSIHIVLTLYKEDLKYIPEKLQLLIDNDVIELIVAEENLRCHLKYFYVMLKYRRVPIITVDDDMLYYPNTVEDLLQEYKKYNCIVSRKCRKMTFDKNKIINPFKKWVWNAIEDKPSRKLHALGFSGVIYPPNALNLQLSNIEEIKTKCLRADDIYLNVLEIRNNVLVKCLHKNYGRLTNYFEKKGFKSLSLDKDNDKITNLYISNFKKEFNSCL